MQYRIEKKMCIRDRDYSNMPFNIYGQICLPFTVIWFFLSFLAIVADDFLRWLWFGERFPEYHLFTKEA